MKSLIYYTSKINSNLTTDIKCCKSVDLYEQLCENLNIYEVIPDDKAIHPYFDFDYYNEEYEYNYDDLFDLENRMIDLGKYYLTECFEEVYNITPTYCVLSSSSIKYKCYKTGKEKWKCSYHIIITNCLMTKTHNKNLTEILNKYAEKLTGNFNYTEYIETTKFFDESVYKPNQKLRAWNSSKEGEDRPLIIKEGTFEESIITHYKNEELPIFECQEQNNNKPNINNNLSQTHSNNEYIQKYRDYVNGINKELYFEPYEKWFKFQRASANIGIPFEVYDEFMRGCKGYDYESNKKYYEMPQDNKKGKIGWGYIYEILKESNPELKNELDTKYGKPNFCKFKFNKLSVDSAEYSEHSKEYEEKEEHFKNELENLQKQKISGKEIEKKGKEFEKILKKEKENLDNIISDLLYLKQKRYFEKFHFKLVSKVCYGRFKEDGFDFLTEDKLKSLYKYIEPFINRWIHDINIKEYEDVDFKPPPIPSKKDVFNLYVGLEYEKNLNSVINMTDDELLNHSHIFIKHLWYLSGKNNQVLDYCLKYIAHIIQDTGTLPRTSIVFKSEQGCGKNIFFENFAEKILGEQYLLATANLDHIIGRFPMISKKLMILMDETNGKESFMGSDKIKSFITAKNIPFEQKGIDPIMIRNCSRMLFFTNNDYPVKIEPTDRRFVVSECSTDIKNDTAYFKNLLNAFMDKTKTTAFGMFLSKLDLSNFDTTNDRPITKIYKEIQTATIPSEVKYFVEANINEDYFTEDLCGKDLYDDYSLWCSMNPKKYKPIAKQTFLTRIKKYEFITHFKNTSGNQVYRINKDLLEEFKNNELQKEDIDDDIEDEFPKIYETDNK